ncbi:hypothetical protein [Streptomyces sp. NPDC048266]|uniref:hypothetical protein n=1 Tax=unclassified Streptomyces TaxID=2593676 RepID=UPI0033DD30EC
MNSPFSPADDPPPAPGTAPRSRPRTALHGRLVPLAHSYRHAGTAVLRVSVGALYCWFGILKLFPGASAAETVAVKAMTELTLGLLPAGICLTLLALAEAAIGLCLITGRFLRTALTAFFLHMTGVFAALILLAGDMWSTYGLVPTLEGQYVIKNIVLIAAGLLVAADEITR